MAATAVVATTVETVVDTTTKHFCLEFIKPVGVARYQPVFFALRSLGVGGCAILVI